ncbi:MAG: hypothetical protein HYV08_16105 [Deltaproteobacteria bacterium]|nr:hypothetical protein [Deltaproteobacteria bacterium]
MAIPEDRRLLRARELLDTLLGSRTFDEAAAQELMGLIEEFYRERREDLVEEFLRDPRVFLAFWTYQQGYQEGFEEGVRRTLRALQGKVGGSVELVREPAGEDLDRLLEELLKKPPAGRA